MRRLPSDNSSAFGADVARRRPLTVAGVTRLHTAPEFDPLMTHPSSGVPPLTAGRRGTGWSTTPSGHQQADLMTRSRGGGGASRWHGVRSRGGLVRVRSYSETVVCSEIGLISRRQTMLSPILSPSCSHSSSLGASSSPIPGLRASRLASAGGRRTV